DSAPGTDAKTAVSGVLFVKKIKSRDKIKLKIRTRIVIKKILNKSARISAKASSVRVEPIAMAIMKPPRSPSQRGKQSARGIIRIYIIVAIIEPKSHGKIMPSASNPYEIMAAATNSSSKRSTFNKITLSIQVSSIIITYIRVDIK